MSDLGSHEVTQVVLMVHGIRDFASDWQAKVKRILNNNPEIVPVGVRFGFYDVLSFAAPIDLSARPYQKLLSAYERVVEAYPTAQISIIAHSFGTYLVGKLLLENASTKVSRIILCGGVIREDYSWDEVVSRFSDNGDSRQIRVLNQCGTADIWPVMAKALSSRYGNTGRRGMEDDVHTTSVFYNGGHSLFFTEKHIRNSWKPFLVDGQIPQSNSAPPRPSLLERAFYLPFVTTLFRLIAGLAWLLLYLWPVTVLAVATLPWVLSGPQDSVEGRTIDLGNYIENIREAAMSPDETMIDRHVFDLLQEREVFVSFPAAITAIDPVGSNGAYELQLAPPTPAGIRDSAEIVYVTFGKEQLPENIDFTALAPVDGRYQVVDVSMLLDNILWSPREKSGAISAIGVAMSLAGRDRIATEGKAE